MTRHPHGAEAEFADTPNLAAIALSEDRSHHTYSSPESALRRTSIGALSGDWRGG